MNQKWLANEQRKIRKANVLLAKVNPARKTSNRYGALMTPLITSQSHIAELRKQQEALRAAQAEKAKEDSCIIPIASLGIPSGRDSDYNADSINKQAVDLVRSPVSKRRATLKLAFAEAANLQNKLSSFASALPDRKEKVDSSSDDESSIPSNRGGQRTGVLNLLTMSAAGLQPTKTAKPHTKPTAFQREKISAVKRNLLSLDSANLGVGNNDKIMEADSENASPRKQSVIGVPEPKGPKPAHCLIFPQLDRQNCNKALLKYVSTKLTNYPPGRMMMTVSPLTNVTSAPSPSARIFRQHQKSVSSMVVKSEILKDYLGAKLPYLSKTVRNRKSGSHLTSVKTSTSSVKKYQQQSSATQRKNLSLSVQQKYHCSPERPQFPAKRVYGRVTSALDKIHV